MRETHFQYFLFLKKLTSTDTKRKGLREDKSDTKTRQIWKTSTNFDVETTKFCLRRVVRGQRFLKISHSSSIYK